MALKLLMLRLTQIKELCMTYMVINRKEAVDMLFHVHQIEEGALLSPSDITDEQLDEAHEIYLKLKELVK